MPRPALLVLCGLLVACSAGEPLTLTPEATRWRPLLIADVAALMPPPPGPAVEPMPAGGQPDPAASAALARWSADDPVGDWSAAAAALLAQDDLPDAAYSARVLALATAAGYDALLVVWRTKARDARPGPPGAPPGVPSFPAVEPAVATAMSEVLAHAFPAAARGLRAQARAVGSLPLVEGRVWPADVVGGTDIGRAVARVAIARWDIDAAAPPIQAGAGWHDAWPTRPEAGNWAPWIALEVPVAPPGDPREELKAAVAANQAMTIRSRALALKWGEVDMARLWRARAAELVTARGPGPMAAARIHAYTAIALADAARIATGAQYRFGRPRPTGLVPVAPAPAHPAYPADGAALATAAAGYLATAFPLEAPALKAEAAEAGEAGVFAGWQVYSDVVAGTQVGEAVAARVIARAAAD